MRLHIYIYTFLCLAACDAQKQEMPITKDAFDFDPTFIKTTNRNTDPNALIPPKALSAQVMGGSVVLSWQMPKYYSLEKYGVGYRVYMKEGGEGANNSWDFVTPYSSDRANFIKAIAASDITYCQTSGICTFTVKTGGPKTMLFAIVTSNSIANNNIGGRESEPATTSANTLYEVDDARYNLGFIDGKFGGIVDSDEPPSTNPSQASQLFSWRHKTMPWQIPVDGYVMSDWVSNSSYIDGYGKPGSYLSPVLASVDTKGDYESIADPGNGRIIIRSRQTLSVCDDAIGTAAYAQCLNLLKSAPLVRTAFVGQPNSTSNFSFFDNPLGPARALHGGTYASSIVRDKTGQVWFFVADTARILVRKGIPRSCSLEEIASFSREIGGVLSDGTVVGPEGACGFSWSIGTISPKYACATRSDGTTVSGGAECTEQDIVKSISDSTPPSDHTLRYPGAPIIVGDHLYIPDAGNARVVRLPNFITSLQTCGRFKQPGESPDSTCTFDMVLGQTNTSPDANNKFTQRKCVRGGERGGTAGLVSLPDYFGVADPLEPTCASSSDPACFSNTGTGAACLLDLVQESVPGSSLIKTRRSRSIHNFKNTTPGVSMLSASTGLLDDKALSMFRFPVSLFMDYKGRLIVFDVGHTIAEEASAAPTHAVLGSRALVWNRDPLQIPFCPAGGDCSIGSTGLCSGPDCSVRQCLEAECQAYSIIGQKTSKFAPAGFSGPTFLRPNEGDRGFIPLISISIASSEEGRGIWGVTGINRRIYRWKEIDQYELPVIHNTDQKNGINGEPMLGGAFMGILINTNNSIISGLDGIKNYIMQWSAPPSEDAVSDNPFQF